MAEMIPAVLTTFLFAVSAVSAGRSTRMLGGTTANVSRLVLAAVCLALWAHCRGQGVTGKSLPWFVLSGVVGFGFGDLALYGAYPRIGPRLGVLLCVCLAAPFGGLAEWIWLGTPLTLYQIAWGTTVLVGVAVAVGPDRQGSVGKRAWSTGILLGVIAGMGQGGGAVLTRKAFSVARQTGHPIDGGTAAYQRILGGLLLTFVVLLGREAFLRLRAKGTGAGDSSSTVGLWGRAWPWVVINALAGPAIGVACFQWALSEAPTGIVLAIVALTPLAVIPLTMIVDGERPRVSSLVGGAIAVLGAVALAS